MGVVYLAEQKEPVARRVALKIIKPGMDSQQVIARFEAERQALALMDHPNIAKVLDAGTTDSGRPYFVMELVNGIPVTEFCDRHHLTARERLELFIPICQAVQHAHQRNIALPASPDKPFPIAETEGLGFLAGYIMGWRQKDHGDMVFHNSGTRLLIDGQTDPHVICGCNVEDDFGFSWGFNQYQTRWSGCPYAVHQLDSRYGWLRLEHIVQHRPPYPLTEHSYFVRTTLHNQHSFSSGYTTRRRSVTAYRGRFMYWTTSP